MPQSLSPRIMRMTSDERTAETCSINGRVEAVYRKQAAQMWRALLAYSGDPDIASDAVAEAFAQALRRGSAIRQVDRWVWRASFRIAAGELKERRRLVAVVDVPDGIPDTGFGLQDSLLKLSPKQRSSLFLYYYGGYPPRDIASMIGSTPSAVRVHLHCGRKRLAETLNGVSDD